MANDILRLLIILIVLVFFKWCSTGFMYQEHLDDHPDIGKKIQFNQPISYIERENPAIVPIVAKIKKELGGHHKKYDSEKKNEYLSIKTIFTIEDVYAYRDIINNRSILYILTHDDVKYIVNEDSFNRLQKSVYENADVPIEVLENLYKDKTSTSRIRFYIFNKTGRYYDVFNIEQFEKCNIQNITSDDKGITATVNFNELSCLYFNLWDNIHSESYPVKYELLK